MKNTILIFALLFSGLSFGQNKIRLVHTMNLSQLISIKGSLINKTETNYIAVYDENEIQITNKKTNEKMKFVVWGDEKEFGGTYKQGGLGYYMQFFQPFYYLDNKTQGQIENILIDIMKNKIVIYNNGDILIFSN